MIGSIRRPPPHVSFSHLKFASVGADGGVLEENEGEYDQSFALTLEGDEATWSSRKSNLGNEEEVRGSWLEADDIEDF